MSEKKNIDRLFQESFKDFEAQPPSMVWDGIEKNLDQIKKRRVVPLWWMIGGIAAGLAILFTSMYLGIDNINSNKQDQIVTTEKTTNSQNDSLNTLEVDKSNSAQENESLEIEDFNDSELTSQDSKRDTVSLNNLNYRSSSSNPVDVANQNNTLANSNDESIEIKDYKNKKTSEKTVKGYQNSKETTIVQKNNFIPAPQYHNNAIVNSGKNEVNTIDNNTVSNDNRKEGVASNKPNDYLKGNIKDKLLDNAIATAIDSTKKKLPRLEDIAAQQQKKDSIKDVSFKSSWAASTQIGPVYSNNLGGSSVNEEVKGNDRNAGLNLSYGIGLSYQISPRLSVRTGINQVNMSYVTQDINYSVNVDIAARGSVAIQSYNPTAVSSSLPSNNTPFTNADALQTGFAQEELVNNQFQGIKGEIAQQLGYLEVPLELQYSIVNSKFKLNLMGGMSALFITDNTVAVQNSGERLELGEDRNFNDFNQSANLGLGLGYDFSNKIGFFVEPIFKYQLSTLRTNSADFKPYTLGVQSGVIYTF